MTKYSHLSFSLNGKDATRLTRRHWLTGMVTTAIATMLVSCSGTAPNQSGESAPDAVQSEGEPIKIGLLQPLTGPVSAAGIAIKDAAEIAVEEVNEAGGINGRPIELAIEDTANDPAQCTSAANKVISRDQVEAIIGAWGSSCTLAVIPVIERSEVPLLVETSSSYKVTDPQESGNEWTFRLSPPTPLEAWVLRGKLVSDLGLKNVFFLSVNNDWGRGAVTAYEPYIEEEGGQIIGTEYFEQSEVDFKPLLNRVQSSNADSVIITTDATQIALMLEQMKTLGMDLKVLTTGGSNWPIKIVKLAGNEAAANTYHTIFFPGAFEASLSESPEQAEQFIEKWQQQGYEATELGEAGRGYDAVYTLATALETIESNNISPETIQDALVQVSHGGIMYGDIAFKEWQGLINQNIAPVYIGQISDDGSLQFVVSPDREVTADDSAN